MKEKATHEGRNVKRFREILGIKKETLAADLKLSQQAISTLEDMQSLDKETLDKIARALKIPAAAIKNFSDDVVVNVMTFHDYYAVNLNYQCTLDASDKYSQVVEENKKLYEQLLQAEREKSALLEKLNSKK